MDLELKHLRLLVEIADRGGLTRAADSLHLTQSALSHQLRDAEDRLGTPLFRRQRRVLVRTPAGDRLLATARRVLEELSVAEADARRAAGAKHEKIRLTTECYTCYHWLGPLMTRFRSRFPDVDVEVVVEATRQPMQWVLAGKLDVGITMPPARRDKRLAFDPVLEDELVGIVPADHRLASKKWLSPADFAGEAIILYDAPLEESSFLQRFLKPGGVKPTRIHQVQLTEAILELVRGGMGLTALARWSIESQARQLGLVLRPLGPKGMRRSWCAVRRAGVAPEHIAAFIELLAHSSSPARA